MNRRVQFLMVLALVLLSACGSLRQQAFKSTEGNSVLLVNSEAEVKKSLLMTLATKGFQSESREGGTVIKASKIIRDGGKSCAISMDCRLFALDGSTKLQVVATEEISETSSHLKWFLFFPYGTSNTTAIVSSETIDDKVFYASFFKEVRADLANMAKK